jgi:Ca-activated chloride channel family protein
MKLIIPSIAWAGFSYWPCGSLLIVAFVILVYAQYVRHSLVNLLQPKNTTVILINHYNPLRYSLKIIAWLIGGCAVVCILLQPQWGKKEEVVKQVGRDIVIGLDVSRSMLAQDFSPNRLEVAKEKIRNIIKRLPSERVALLLFSGSAVVQCPLTNDYAAFSLFLDQIDAQTMSGGTTALDKALSKAISLFDKNQDRKNKIIVLITDGEDFSSNLAKIKQEALASRLHIFTIGIGTQHGAPIPLVDEHGMQQGHQKDDRGSIVISRLNEGILRSLAHDSGGIYVQASTDDADINEVVNKVKEFEQEEFEDRTLASLHQRYHYCAALALLFFVLEWIL